jgi:hypothetical protein
MIIKWLIPEVITQGDRVTWSQYLPDYSPTTDTLSCFIRGVSQGFDLTGVSNNDGWDFVITDNQTAALAPGKYQAQFLIFESAIGRKALGIAHLIVLPGFDNLTDIDFRSPDEQELALITTAIAKLVSGAVAEYRIGDRMMRYQDLTALTTRQKELRNRIAKTQNRGTIGGRNVGIRFSE